MSHNLKLFYQFFRRDCYVHSKHIKTYLINYLLIYPIIWSFLTAYMQANTYFSGDNVALKGTLLSCGNIILMMMVFTYAQQIELLYDLEGDRYINYQLCIASPFLILIEKVIFIGLLCFLLCAPYYPIAKCVLPAYIDTSNSSWPLVMIIILFGSLWCSSYHLLASCFLSSTDNIASLWRRLNAPLMDFGGLWIPWFILNKYSTTLSTVAYFNPIMYITDGIKQALIGGTEFFSLTTCIPVLISATILCTLLSCHLLKKRLNSL